jgi:RNA polymerase sigma-70 factor (ECF subfamily)
MSNPSDESLMLGVAGGDPGAFEQLVVRHQELVWRTAYRMVGDRQAAEDLAQDAFVRVFRAADRYRPTAAFRTYLYRIVVRVCLDHLRKKRPQPGADLSQVAEPAPAIEQQTELRERADLVQQAVASLPPKQRSAVVLRYYEGLSGAEIADVMKTTPKAVERLLARGRSALQRRLARLLHDA